jgi:hypothetical protein
LPLCIFYEYYKCEEFDLTVILESCREEFDYCSNISNI